MATYVSLFNYSSEGVKGISSKRTGQAKEAIEKAGGKYVAAYGLLGPYDAIVIAEYPDEKAATKGVLALSKLIGASSKTMTAIPIEEFDRLVG